MEVALPDIEDRAIPLFRLRVYRDLTLMAPSRTLDLLSARVRARGCGRRLPPLTLIDLETNRGLHRGTRTVEPGCLQS
jgi:hypothetical protein